MPTAQSPAQTCHFADFRSRRETFLSASGNANDHIVPLSRFMMHVARLAGLGQAELNVPEQRFKFVCWFLDTFHRLRAPYHWPLPDPLLQWLNYPALDIPEPPAEQPLRGHRRYLTRFMLHVWQHFRKDLPVYEPNGYLQFLTWFALDCIPQWNLPRLLLPNDLLPWLNEHVRGESHPLTAAMLAHGRMREPERYDDLLASASPDVVLAASFELLHDVLEAGDPRLVPASVSRFWFSRLSSEPLALRVYEYLAARAFGDPSEADPTILDGAPVRRWLASRYRDVVPYSDVLLLPPPEVPDGGGLTQAAWRPLDHAIFLYRDHRSTSGLAQAGLVTCEALKRAGLHVVDLDFSLGRNRLPEEFQHNEGQFSHARSAVHLLSLNPEYVPECVMTHLPKVNDAHYVIGQFYWELSDISSIHECGLSLVDEIWVASTFLKELYQKRTGVPVIVMGQAITHHGDESCPHLNRSSFGLSAEDYVFLFTFDAGSSIERKNPLAAAAAFRKAFPRGTEKATLLLKTRNVEHAQTDQDRRHWRQVLDIAAADARIRIVDHTMSRDELTALYAMCDCYLSLHRSEGFGFGPAEALSAGKPVITTGYSGVTDFCTQESALLVNYKLEPVPEAHYPFMDADRAYEWAAPDLRHAAAHMRRLYEDPRAGVALGAAGRRIIRESYSISALVQRVRARLDELGAFGK